MKKIFLASVIFVLLLTVGVFAFNKSGAANESSCPLKQSAQASTTEDYSSIVVKSDENCCYPGAACCTGGACCKTKQNKN